eukprot:TRINITY_DN2680_c0_g1_i1.p1 TRINITY_DN2680_c0_g1~~TRINITY_DN2680_c0_g1_i1.p1  ORF type:complete len:268 (-),score=18.44 TRINITY_DN2680_c0_g1_i1:107-910(-)
MADPTLSPVFAAAASAAAAVDAAGSTLAPAANILTDFLNHVKFGNPEFLYALVMIAAAPLIWNSLARLEFYTQAISTITNSRVFGCYLLAAWIFGFSSYRDKVVHDAMAVQVQWPLLDSPVATVAGYGLLAIGFTLVLGSFYQLGITGTFLGDYFGILMKERVTAFPFNILENPMYVGSVLNFTGFSLINKSAAGLALTMWVFVIYQFAQIFEGSFTTYIYSRAAKQKRKAIKKGKSYKGGKNFKSHKSGKAPKGYKGFNKRRNSRK